jgi:hypothetical protein
MGGMSTPRAIWTSAAFFALSGLLEIGLGVAEAPRPITFWPIWEALGRGLLCLLLAGGLWSRLALCRSIAMVYCLAALTTYAVVLGMALLHAPVQFPLSIVVLSLFQVPSCALLFPFFRSPEASRLFGRPLFGR